MSYLLTTFLILERQKAGRSRNGDFSSSIIFSLPFYPISQPLFQFLFKISSSQPFFSPAQGSPSMRPLSLPADPSPFSILYCQLSLLSQEAWTRLGRNTCEQLSFVLLLALRSGHVFQAGLPIRVPERNEQIGGVVSSSATSRAGGGMIRRPKLIRKDLLPRKEKMAFQLPGKEWEEHMESVADLGQSVDKSVYPYFCNKMNMSRS